MARRLFVFDEERDADILDWLDSIPGGEKSGEVRAALRAWISNPPEPPNSTILRAVRDLRDMLKSGSIAVVMDGDSGVEPEEARRNLDNLASMIDSGGFG